MASAMTEIGYRTNPTPVFTHAGDILKDQSPPEYFEKLVNDAEGGTLFIDVLLVYVFLSLLVNALLL